MNDTVVLVTGVTGFIAKHSTVELVNAGYRVRGTIAPWVERFVHTSSTVAVQHGHPRDRTAPVTEADWTVVDAPGVTPYAKSKTLAERVEELGGVRLVL